MVTRVAPACAQLITALFCDDEVICHVMKKSLPATPVATTSELSLQAGIPKLTTTPSKSVFRIFIEPPRECADAHPKRVQPTSHRRAHTVTARWLVHLRRDNRIFSAAVVGQGRPPTIDAR